MDRLVDARSLRSGGAALREFLAHEGYLFLPQLLDPAGVAAVEAEVAQALVDAGWADATDPRAARPARGPVLDRDPDFLLGYACIQGIEAFHRLAHDERLLELLETLFGSLPLVHPRKTCRAIWPGGAGTATPNHQDWPFEQGTSDLVTAWVPLHDCPPETGALRVLRGSHRALRVLPLHPVDGPGGFGLDVAADDPRWATAAFRAGDVLVFHGCTVHGSLANGSDRIRLSVDYRYQPRTEPIGTPALMPHRYPAVPGWRTLTAGWSTTKWADPPAGVRRFVPRMVAVDRYHEELVPPPSRLVGEVGAEVPAR
jgi:ectoine hydroxylase-related dioxygenase (phytanoyl-CoA dioxygenase family)